MKITTLLIAFAFVPLFVYSQTEIAFISDTQNKTKAERLISRHEHNAYATVLLYSYILHKQPAALFNLGDIVGIGSSAKNWKSIDYFFESLKQKNIPYYATPGNHEYLLKTQKGKQNFEQRFGNLNENNNINFQIINSIAVVLINSNFKKLTIDETKNMLFRYNFVLDSLQQSKNVRCIIIATHYSPFTNSSIVKPSEQVSNLLVPKYLETSKAILFLSGHAHLQELFLYEGKYFCVIGGGGGRKQAQLKGNKQRYNNLLDDVKCFRYFYCTISVNSNVLYLYANGMNVNDWEEKTQEILSIKL